ncbi:MAG: glycoside hydrolase family 172 protein [Armatimonadota bacterium]
MRRFALVFGLLCFAAGTASTGAPLSVAQFLQEMVDLERLTRMPSPHYVSRQFSSYDRASRLEGGRKVNWFANGDAGHYLRDERRGGEVEHVMMDAEGPGVITRIWSANPDNTRIRFYIDGAQEPTFEADFLALTTGRVQPFAFPFSHRLSAGANLYFPIPFAKHCKVTHTGRGIYYHIDYRTYPKGTAIKSFNPGDLEALRPAIERVGKVLSNPDVLNMRPSRKVTVVLRPGERKDVLREAGPAAVRYLAVRVEAADLESALRQTHLTFRFDSRGPQVDCPLGDFFGTGPGANPYTSLPCTVTKEGELRSRWVMPFRQAAVMSLANLSEQPVRVFVQAAVGPYRWTAQSCHFYARWRADFDVPTRPFRDMRWVEVSGAGRYVGSTLEITNPWSDWWGEGDEKIYVDGEAFPSYFGTGTEDYFGYAWGSPQLYTHAYHAQPRCDGPGTFGHNSEVRWHLFDDIPFAKGIIFDLELWHWREGRVPIYARMAYYYAKPGAVDDHPPVARGALRMPVKPARPL